MFLVPVRATVRSFGLAVDNAPGGGSRSDLRHGRGGKPGAGCSPSGARQCPGVLGMGNSDGTGRGVRGRSEISAAGPVSLDVASWVMLIKTHAIPHQELLLLER